MSNAYLLFFYMPEIKNTETKQMIDFTYVDRIESDPVQFSKHGFCVNIRLAPFSISHLSPTVLWFCI